MKKVLNQISRLARDEDGAALLEYTVLAGVMIISVILAIVAVAGVVLGKWTTLNSNLAGI